MRRYSRYKICKTNFHFFFFPSRLIKFKRPKWLICKEKIKFIKKKNFQAINFFPSALCFYYHFSNIFKLKYFSKKFNSNHVSSFSKNSLVVLDKNDYKHFFTLQTRKLDYNFINSLKF